MRKIITLAFLLAAVSASADTGVTLYSNTTSYLQMRAPNGMTSNYRMVMPLTVGATNQVLSINSVAGSTMTMGFVAQSGGGGGSGSFSLAITTGGPNSFTGAAISSSNSTTEILFDSATHLGRLLSGGTYYDQLNPSSVTLQGNSVTFVQVGASTQALAASLFNTSTTTGTLQTQITSVGAATGTLATSLFDTSSSTGPIWTQLAAVQTATSTLSTNLFATSSSTGPIWTQLAAVQTATTTLSTNLFATSSSTGPIWTQLAAVQTATSTLASNLFLTSTATGTLAGLTSTNTFTAPQSWTNINTSTITKVYVSTMTVSSITVNGVNGLTVNYNLNITTVTGGGLGSCGDSTHGLGFTSTGTFTCQSVTGSAGSGVVVPSSYTWNNVSMGSSATATYMSVLSSMTVGSGNNGNQIIISGGASASSNVMMTLLPNGTSSGTGVKILAGEQTAANTMGQIEFLDTGNASQGIVMNFYTSRNASSLNKTLTLAGAVASTDRPTVGVNQSVPGAYFDAESFNSGGGNSLSIIRSVAGTNATGNLYDGINGSTRWFTVGNSGAVTTESSMTVTNNLGVLGSIDQPATFSSSATFNGVLGATVTYGLAITTMTGGGLGTCGDSTHGLGFTSTGTFQCQSITGSGGAGGGGVVVPSTFTWGSVTTSSLTVVGPVVFASTSMVVVGTSTIVLVTTGSFNVVGSTYVANSLVVSTSPSGVGLIQVSSTVPYNQTDFVVTIASPSIASTVLWGVQLNGHMVSSGTTPTVNVTGATTPTMDAMSTDMVGRFEFGGTLTSVALTYGGTYSIAPACVVYTTATAVSASSYGVISSTFSLPAGGIINSTGTWHCFGGKGS